ncbi:MAG: aminoacyl-tRNA hydrolase [bacterium]|nr:aminoacyl-tRNA hydrolase [bacterium]
MKLIVGLGNPGTEYETTRHNAGFLAVDYLMEKWLEEGRIEKPSISKDKTYIAYETKYTRDDGKHESITFLKPLTFMNLSGTSVKKYLSYHRTIDITKDIWISHDELDIPFGKIKISHNRSSAGHNGVQNIIDLLGTKEFSRMRIGVASERPVTISGEKFVLGKFSATEKKALPEVFETIKKGLELSL